MYMVLTTGRFFEATIRSWPDRDFSQLSYQAMSPTRTQSQLCTATVSVTLHFGYCLRQLPRLF